MARPFVRLPDGKSNARLVMRTSSDEHPAGDDDEEAGAGSSKSAKSKKSKGSKSGGAVAERDTVEQFKGVAIEVRGSATHVGSGPCRASVWDVLRHAAVLGCSTCVSKGLGAVFLTPVSCSPRTTCRCGPVGKTRCQRSPSSSPFRYIGTHCRPVVL